ncbi:MAG TPA: energy transducer TonB [Vicinamibacterales bacterium]|nr:energy transducer TonB [Vicinamibacterales bacterium]
MRALLLGAMLVSLVPQQPAPVPVRPGNGITDPKLVRSVQPKYTLEAIKAKISGTVELEAVVLTDGTVGDVTITKSLDKDLGLDQAAIAAAKQWTFRPGVDPNGNPVKVIVTLKLEFRLTDRADQLPTLPVRAPILSEVPQDFRLDARVFGTLGLQSPALTASVEPKYTSAAMLAKIQGSVDVDVVIGPDGRVARARVARSLDAINGLDVNALAAAKEWTFTPGLEGGQPVPVLARLTLNFRLH